MDCRVVDPNVGWGRMRVAPWAVGLGLMALGLFPGAAKANDVYYVLVFGSQTEPKRLRDTHTWATFVHAVGEGADPNGYALEYLTISWLPRTLDIRVLRPWPEPGVNLDLYQTLDVVLSKNEKVSLWGPFQVSRHVFDDALRMKQFVESGQVKYRAWDAPYQKFISDCIHAVAMVDPVFGREHYPLIRIGKPASRYIGRQVMLRSEFDQEAYDHSWLIPRLGLNRYPMQVVPPRIIPERNCVLCLGPEG